MTRVSHFATLFGVADDTSSGEPGSGEYEDDEEPLDESAEAPAEVVLEEPAASLPLIPAAGTQRQCDVIATALNEIDSKLHDFIRARGLFADGQPLSRQSAEAVETMIFARCWNMSERAPARSVTFQLTAGQTIEQARESEDLSWNPQWLIDAGHRVADQNGVDLSDGVAVATVSGPAQWIPDVALPKLQDRAPTTAAGRRKKVAGEVAVAALWAQRANAHGVALADIETSYGPKSQNERGSRFRRAVALWLCQMLQPEWDVPIEIPLPRILGLHLRRETMPRPTLPGMGGKIKERSADIGIVDADQRLIALVSSKWSWRSDRGSEAAQMVLLNRYRPEVPYVLVTAEFPRAAEIVAKSVEDRVFHLSPALLGAWLVTQTTEYSGRYWPRLSGLTRAGQEIAKDLRMGHPYDLAVAASAAGTWR